MMYFLHKTKRAYQNTKGGFTLFYAALVSSLLLAIGLAILNITLKEFVLSSGARDSETAFYSADSALECALFWDNTLRIFGYYGDSLAENLAGYWRFEEPLEQQNAIPQILIDSSGSGNHMVTNDGMTWISDGAIDQALSPNRTGKYAEVQNIPGVKEGKTEHTISAWVRIRQYPAVRSWVLVLGNRTTGAHHWLINGLSNPEGYIEGQMQIGVWGGVEGAEQAHPILPLDRWTHIVSVFDGTTLTVYVDGEETKDTPTSANFDLAGVPFNIGEASGGQESFNGDIDDVRIYSRALSKVEVNAIASRELLAGFVPPIEQGVAQPGEITCAANNINSPDSGWWMEGEEPLGWEVENLSPDDDGLEYYKTTFDVLFSNNTCGLVEVYKDDKASTTIISRGYNTCDLNNPRRLERAIRAQY